MKNQANRHPKKAAQKNLKEGLEGLKGYVWKRYQYRLDFSAAVEKQSYDKLTYDEAIRHALSMAGLDPLIKQSNQLISNISKVQLFKCAVKYNRKAKNKKKALKKFYKARKKCNNRKKFLIRGYRKTLADVNSKLEPSRQQKLAEHMQKTDAINNWIASARIVLRNTSNNDTLKELHTATILANKGRVLIGLPKLDLPYPKMSSLNPAQSEFWGMMTAGNINFARAAQAGVGTVRFNMLWYATRDEGAGYRWGAMDAGFREAAMAGIRVTPTFYGNAVGGPEFMRVGLKDWRLYTAYIKAGVKRYGYNGTFWKENPSVPYMPVSMWGVWNEPNFVHNNPGGKKVQTGEYAKLIVGVSRAIRSVNKGAIVSFGGLSNAQNATKNVGMSGAAFLKALYRYPEVRASFDAVSFHPYSSTVERMADSVEEIRGIMNAHGDKAKPLYITEVGWATGGPPGGLVVSEQKQAENLTAAMNWFKANKDRLNIPVVAWYFWKDVSTAIYGKKLNWDSYAGLFDINGRAKPSWYAFLQATGGI